MTHGLSYIIQPLGDAALLLDFGNRVDEKINHRVIALFHFFQQHGFEGMIEVVPAYSSLAIFYHIDLVRQNTPDHISVFESVKAYVESILTDIQTKDEIGGRLFQIPVYYSVKTGVDLNGVSEKLHLSTNEIVELHTSKTYRVYMMGFLPGFPYLGEVNEKLIVPRKNNPVKVVAGSVGLAGRQTGIYPFDSPGGWQIIGRTPVTLFDQKKEIPVMLKAGDQVKFYSITSDEFENYQVGNS